MKDAKSLLVEFTASSFEDPRPVLELFSEHGAFEMPYLSDFGVPPRFAGRSEIAGFFEFVRDLYPGVKFENVNVLMESEFSVSLHDAAGRNW
jgi:hypothetical protein